MAIKITMRHPSFFAEISGVDLCQPLSQTRWTEIEAAFNAHAILLFRNQPLTDEQHIAFSARFGPIFTATNYHWKTDKRRVHAKMADISNISDDGSILPADDERLLHNRANELWHTDNTFKYVPARCSLLLAREVPNQGGDTEFADMRAAYDALASTKKIEIENLVVEHSIVYSRTLLGFNCFTEGAKKELPPVPQVLVRHNRKTNRKALYLASHGSHIIGWPKKRGRHLLDELTAHATQASFTYRHKWRKGDLIIWDNRCTMHRATTYDQFKTRRDLQRTTVSDEINSVERRELEKTCQLTKTVRV